MIIDRALTDSFNALGDWFLPDSPDHRLAGRLSYTPERTELIVNGTFRPDVPGILQVGSDYSIVHGVTHDGETITLLNSRCIERTSQTTSVEIEKERLLILLLVVGAHLTESSTFPAFSFRIPGLQVWLSRESIDQSLERDESNRIITHVYRVRDRKEDSVYVPVIHATLSWFVGYTSVVDPFSSISVETAARMTVRPDSPQSLNWYFAEYHKVTTLLSIIAGGPMFADCMNLFLTGPGDRCSVLQATPGQRYWFRPRIQDFYLSCGDLGLSFSDIIIKWFEVFDKVDTPSRLAASVLASQNLWPHIAFLSLIHALEGLHRGLFDGLYMPCKDYVNVRNTINAAIPSSISQSHKSALQSRIRYGNEVSLRTRLNELARKLSQVTRKRIFGRDDGAVPHQWIDTRNYYSHWDQGSRENLLENEDLDNANLRIRHFVRALYLQLIQVPEDAIKRGVFGSSDDARLLTHINS
jgi:hypothetical protein